MTRTFWVAALTLTAAWNAWTAELPFQIDASEDVSAEFLGAPRLHSFVSAEWDGKWIFIAGRTGGYHGVGQGDVDFPRSRANQKIWVIEPPTASAAAKIYSFPVASLPANLNAVKDQWMATSLLYVQDKDTLYIAGGYGENSNHELVTYPVLSAVNLPALVQGVMAGKDSFSKTISYVESPLVQSTGGNLIKLDDGLFYLVGGHVFMGSYRSFEAAGEKTTQKASQTYLAEIRKLRIGHAASGMLEVSLVETFKNPEFARRDLNVAPVILPDGKSLGAAAYGGVFTKDQLNFPHPVYFSSKSAPKVDSYEQKMSGYTCAMLLMFDPDNARMYTTFFGGISRWLWNYTTHAFELAPKVGEKNRQTGYMDGLPWVDHISTLTNDRGELSEFVQDHRLPAYVGGNGVFLPAPGLKRVREDTDIFDLRQFRGNRVLAGYIYGGIRAFPKQFPYTDEAPGYTSGNVPNKSSDVILKVYVTAAPAAK